MADIGIEAAFGIWLANLHVTRRNSGQPVALEPLAVTENVV
ncbi:MAG: hypothetical protein QW227_00345 [Candidatus Aenigmatarchaeota archaeon]